MLDFKNYRNKLEEEMSKKISIFLGSLRKNSFNKTLEEYVEKRLKEEGFEPVVFPVQQLPFINQDEEFPAPTKVAELREEVRASKALWIFSPEYNGDIPAQIKNAMDWLSRPLNKGEGRPEFMKEKPLFITAAAGKSGAKNVIARLEEQGRRIQLMPQEASVGVSVSGDSFANDKLELTEEIKGLLDSQIEVLKKI